MEKEKTEYYSILENRKEMARKYAITLIFPFTLVLLALYGLTFNPYNVISTMSWIFGSYSSLLLISFSKILLLLFSIFFGIFFLVYLRKYISTKKIIKEFSAH